MHGKGTLSISRIERGFLFDIGLTPFGWKLIDQGKYVGEWKNGKEHGKGIRFYFCFLSTFSSKPNILLKYLFGVNLLVRE